MSAAVEGSYLGLPLRIESYDHENRAYFRYCASGELHLQSCRSCQLLRYPPTAGCPWCGESESHWLPVSDRGSVYSYAEVHHAIQPAFHNALPYLILIVELDQQRGQPNASDALRICANLATANGELAPPELVERIGIGSRVRLVYKRINDDLALPMWALDKDAEQPDRPWRYSELLAQSE